jgi:hypothetical protein
MYEWHFDKLRDLQLEGKFYNSGLTSDALIKQQLNKVGIHF